MKHRPPEIERYKQTWLTKEGYELLRKEKKNQKKSITKLIDEAIKKAYE